MTSFVLKIIAYFSMFCDHFGDFRFEGITFLNYIGRFAFTIFAFQVVLGYIHTHNLKKYIMRLLLLAIISQIPYMIFYYAVFDKYLEVNVIFTLLFGLLSITVYDKYNKFVGICSFLLMGLVAQICNFDYGFYGVFIIFMFYLLRDHIFYTSIVFIFAVIIYYYCSIINYHLPITYLFNHKNTYALCMYSTCLSILPVLLYNGKKGKDFKYFLYIFYPIHLLVLGLIKLYIIQ